MEHKGGLQMSGKKVGVFGIYASRLAVEKTTDLLITAGFPASGGSSVWNGGLVGAAGILDLANPAETAG